MKAVILAAGVGKRLKPLTDSIPKCLIKINGEALIERHIKYLKECGIRDIVIVTGHLKELIAKALGNKDRSIKFIYNPDYKKGSAMSLYTARNGLESDCLVMDADVYFEKRVLERLIRSVHQNCFLIDSSCSNTGEEMMIAVINNRVTAIERGLKGKCDLIGEGVGFAKISGPTAKDLKATLAEFISKGSIEAEYEECLNELVKKDIFGCEKVDDLKWTEIDFMDDIKRTERIASEA